MSSLKNKFKPRHWQAAGILLLILLAALQLCAVTVSFDLGNLENLADPDACIGFNFFVGRYALMCAGYQAIQQFENDTEYVP